MSNKRKNIQPCRLDDDKRSRLQWNMSDLQTKKIDHTTSSETTEEDDLYSSSADKTCSTLVQQPRDITVREIALKDLLNHCEFYITVRSKHLTDLTYCLATFTVKLLEESGDAFSKIFEISEDSFWMYGSQITSKSFLYFGNEENFHYFIVDIQLPFDVLKSLKNNNRFVCTVCRFDRNEETLEISINYQHSNVFDLSYNSERCIKKSHLDKIIPYFYPKCQISAEFEKKDYTSKEIDIHHVFEAIKQIHESEIMNSQLNDVQHEALVPILRPYQKKGVTWMLKRETGHQSQGVHGHQSNELHSLYEEIQLSDGELLYYNKYGGFLVRNRPLKMAELPGGILADEMGLGKTVQVLACILNNQRVLPHTTVDIDKKVIESEEIHTETNEITLDCFCGTMVYDKTCVQCNMCNRWQHASCVSYNIEDECREEYRCPHCHLIATPIVSGATLIVSPRSICHQWNEEIHKHIKHDSLKVIIYTGVNKGSYIQPQDLADSDIVITTYQTLKNEINFIDLADWNNENSAHPKLRHKKRFQSVPSPLTAVQWWRICLDEAQMVGCSSSRASDMALRLHAVNRWCVTGTPTQNSVRDLYGLFLFLGTDPFYVKHWWNVLLYQPYCHGNVQPMYNAVANVLWRTAKKDVEDQIDIPDQSENINWLQFSPIECHFYRQLYEHCFDVMKQKLSKYSSETKLKSLDRLTVKKLLQPLLKLRQACCHPQAVRGTFLSLQRTTMTMQELLEQMIKKTVNDCEEAHRLKVAAHNGVAGIYILQEKVELAIEEYRNVLQSIEEHKSKLRTDELQQLHTLYNLHQLISSLGGTADAIPRTLRDDRLLIEAEELKEKYMIKSISLVNEAEKNLLTLQDRLKQHNQQYEEDSLWWCDVIQLACYTNTDTDLTDRVINELMSNITSNNTTFAHDFSDLRGLEFIVARKLERLQQSHDDLIKSLKYLCDSRDSNELLNSAVECCLRPSQSNSNKCSFCKTEDLFTKYETQLFSMDDRGAATNESRRQGNWAESELERALRVILSFTRTRGDLNLIEAGNLQMKIFETLKKEFRCLRSVWMLLKEQVGAKDELSMATTRLRLCYPGEVKTDPPQMNVLDKFELDPRRLKFIGEKLTAENTLKKKLGQLQYLKNLEQSNDAIQGGVNPEQCPVCQNELGVEWSVLYCGHCFCMQCSQILINGLKTNHRSRNSIKCAVCRQTSQFSDVSFVSTNPERNDHFDLDEKSLSSKITVKGDHSTKISAIIRCLLKIKHSQPTAKALVFSTWQEILEVLSKALVENDINFRAFHNQHKFQENVDEFRHNKDVLALLLPVHLGANGLNLIEATHVLLTEPILNVSQECQAIGRVHRIGQTRETRVHRFLVRGTVEEKISTMLKYVGNEEADVITTDLTIADLGALFNSNNSD